MDSRESAVERAVRLYTIASRAMHSGDGQAWMQVDLSLAQVKALLRLADFGPLSIGGLARRCGIGLPAASSLVDRLVEQGLARRREDPLDRRRTLAELSPEGQALIDRLRQGSDQALRSWLAQVEPGDLGALIRGLEALVGIADREAGVVPPVAATR